MAEPSAPLPVPDRHMIVAIPDATVTRAAVVREGGYHLGAVYDSAGSLVAESLRFPDDRYRAGDPRFLAVGRAAGREVERRMKRAIYLGHAFTHFGHFLVETIPALYWIRYAEADTPLLFHPFDEDGRNVFTDLPYGVECLALLGLSPDRIVMATSDIAVEELLMPPRSYDIKRGPRYDFRDVYRILREAAQRPSGARVRVPHVYLSRRLLNRRFQRLSNEAAVERRLARRGFAIVHPQQLSFAEQINVAAAADVVAGVDGSALHLSAFMRAGSRMLVMQTRRRRNVLFLNALMDVETIALPATPVAGDDQPRIDLTQLDRALDGLGCRPAPGLFRRAVNAIFR